MPAHFHLSMGIQVRVNELEYNVLPYQLSSLDGHCPDRCWRQHGDHGKDSCTACEQEIVVLDCQVHIFQLLVICIL